MNYLTVEKYAQKIGKSRQYIYKLIKAGRLKEFVKYETTHRLIIREDAKLT